MIIKQCQFAGADDNGEYIHLLHAGYDNEQLIKQASEVVSPPQLAHVRHFMHELPRRDGQVYTLVSALGAGEYWSSNSNADFFGEERLLHVPPGWSDLPHAQQVEVGKRWEWGYPTFYNAGVYQHHVNKNPNRSFGTVEYVLWDSQMKRVLLVVSFNRDRAAKFGSTGVLDRLENGENISVSMGCRVPYDICSICADWSRITLNPKIDIAEHRKRPIRGLSTETADYCTHLKNELNKIYPDGRKVMMLNMHPRFFDLSVVFIGADKTSFILAKLAHECPIRPGHKKCASCDHDQCVPAYHVHDVWDRPHSKEKTAGYNGDLDLEWEDPKVEKSVDQYFRRKRMGAGRIKTSELDKDAEIVKQIRSTFRQRLPRLLEDEPELPTELQDEIAERLSDGLSTAGSMGIVAKPREFQRMYIRALGRPRLADDLHRRGMCFRAGGPPADDFRLSGEIIPRLLNALLPLIADRSALSPALGPRVTVVIKKRDIPVIEKEGSDQTFDHPLLEKVSGAYSAYRRELLYKAPLLIKEAIYTHPAINSTLFDDQLISGGLVKAASGVMESIIGTMTTTYLNEAHLPDQVSEYVGSNCDLAGLEKAAGLAVLGGVIA